MKLKKKLTELEKLNPYLSSIVLLAQLVEGKGYGKERLETLIELLVDYEDYAPSDVPQLVEWLFEISKNDIDSHRNKGVSI